MSDIFNNPHLQARNIPMPKRTGRLIMIVDEVGQGVFDIDLQSDMHPAKAAMIGLQLFKNASAAVADEMERREIMNQFEEIAGIVTGRKPSEAAPIMNRQGLQVCEHQYIPQSNRCIKCGKMRLESEHDKF